MIQAQPSIATPETPPPPYWERLDAEQAEAAVVEFVASGELLHIDDGTGENRRLAEGWCSLGGVDWEDEDVPPTVLGAAMEVFAKKNPVVLWDHKRHFPIGELLEWEVGDKGLFVRFRILDKRDFDDLNSDILKKCNEVWSLVRRGIVRGLSWDGRARKRYLWSAELGKYIKQPVEILMSEITVTPVQVHPGAKVTGVNTLSKALRICKALRLGGDAHFTEGEDEMSEKLKKAAQAQRVYLDSLGELPDGIDLPPEMLEIHEGITKALKTGGDDDPPEPQGANDPSEPDTSTASAPGAAMPAEIQEAITKALSPMQQKIDKLEAKLGQPAALRNKVRHGDDPEASARSGEEAGENLCEQMTKALQLGGNTRDGKLDRGHGERMAVSGEDLMGLYMAANDMRLNWKQHRPPEISWGRGAMQLMNQAQQQQ